MAKYWMIYTKNTFKPRTTVSYIESDGLYGYTDRKDLIKSFMSERDMNKFDVVKTNLISDDLLILHDIHPSGYLIREQFTTKAVDNERGYDLINLTMTLGEKLHVSHICQQVILQELWLQIKFDPSIFKEKYINSLEKIGFMIDNSHFDMMPDMVGGFITFFGDTMKVN